MKKIIIASTALLFVGSAVSLTSCTKKLNCATAILNIAQAGSAFDADPSSANCQAFKDALNVYLGNTTCTGADAVSTAEFQAEVDSLSC